MKELRQCQCGSNQLSQNDQGDQYCGSCGRVLQSMKFSNNVAFANLQMTGQVVDTNDKNNKCTVEKRMKRAREKIQELKKLLQIQYDYEEAIDAAVRLIKYANDYNFFDKGRNIQLYAATALYITLRFKKAPYLLIDFSDKMNQNLFKLGRCFLRMSRFLGFQEQLPLIDPSLFIHRYCRMLNLNDKTKDIAATAIRLVQRMKRDWICQGRRPSSLCGASILIATKIHNVKCSTNQICKTVFVCDQTIRRRLEQFKQTNVAKLTREQFQRMQQKLDEIEGEMDPPAFTKARLKSQAQKIRKQEYNKNEMMIATNKVEKQKFGQIEWENYKNNLNIPEEIISGEVKQVEKVLSSASQKYVIRQSDSEALHSITEDQIFNEDSNEEMSSQENNSEIKEEEINKFILTEEEQKVKRNLWKKINKNWIDKQEAKKKKSEKIPKKKIEKNKQQLKNTNAYEAVKNTKMGPNVNDEELKKLLGSKPKSLELNLNLNLNKMFDAFLWKI